MVISGNSPASSGSSTLFRELLSHEHVPRHLTRVPRDQQALLDRPEAWAAGRRGSGNDSVNVPPKVLDHLVYFHTANNLPPPAQKPQPLASSGPSPSGMERAADVPGSQEASRAATASPPSSPSPAPGTPVSWPSSPERPSLSANRDPSPSLSIKSQIGIQSQAPAPSELADIPSSPLNYPSPTRASPKRPIPSTKFAQPVFKRRRIEDFPPSSGGQEDDLEMAIPGALHQDAPPITRIAAHLFTTSNGVAASSPPCGQGSMVPSTYNDPKSPTAASTPGKKRRFKKIKFSSSDDFSGIPLGGVTAAQRSTIPCSQIGERSGSAPSARQTATSSGADSRSSLQAPQVVHETPISTKTKRGKQVQPVVADPRPEAQVTEGSADALVSTTPGDQDDAVVYSRLYNTVVTQTELDAQAKELGMKQLRAQLDHEWDAEGSDWLPPDLRPSRASLSVDSLRVLCNVTKAAVRGGVPLSRLWSEPDGPLYRAAANRPEAELSFSEELDHSVFDFLGSEMTRVERQKRGTAFASPDAQNSTGLPEEVLYPSQEEMSASFAKPPLEAYCEAYPVFSTNTEEFVNACLAVAYLREDGGLPVWLYDDFIRAFITGYVPYVNRHGDDTSALTSLQWYVQNVHRPVFQKSVITSKNLDQVFTAYPEEARILEDSKTDSEVDKSRAAQQKTTRGADESAAKSADDLVPQSRAATAENNPSRPSNGVGAPDDAAKSSALLPAVETPNVHAKDQVRVKNEDDTGESRNILEIPERNPAPCGSSPAPPSGSGDQQQQVGVAQPVQEVEMLDMEDEYGDNEIVIMSTQPEPTASQSNKTTLKKSVGNPAHVNSPSSKSVVQPVSQEPFFAHRHSNFENLSASQKHQDERVAETPRPQKQKPPAASSPPGGNGATSTEKKRMRRSMPATFDWGPQSRVPPGSPTPSTLSTLTQESGVKKSKKTKKTTKKMTSQEYLAHLRAQGFGGPKKT
ncbi:hypothetical protein C8035_v003686 [Colletotrichum spinosum]|uniref:Uncharacterized protein n=1 Tax=Colletotrichum spinosum TaxID=1347390 RepID=A0A4R8QVC7_9PEZI|nr:hypothetical protein C8035_v003686 [Colletotrichum spinosum]